MRKDDKAKRQGESITQRVLDSLSTCIYVSDLETNEILFINDAMAEAFGGGNFVGKTCWKVLQHGMLAPCAFCPCIQLRNDPHTPIIWEEHNGVTGHFYHNTDSVIEWDDGRNVHIQHSQDITAQKMAEMTLQDQVRQQRLLNEISMDFASVGSFDDKVNHSLQLIGEFFAATRVTVFKRDAAKRRMQCVYEWTSSSSCLNAILYEPTFDPTGKLHSDLKRQGTLMLNMHEDLTQEQRNHIMGINPCRAVVQRIEIDDVYWGFIMVDNEESGIWHEQDTQFCKAVASIFSTVIERDEIEKDLAAARHSMRSVLDNAPLGIYWKDLHSIYTGCNMYFSHFVGFDEADIVGKNDFQLFHEQAAREFLAEDSAIIASGQPCADIEFEPSFTNGKQGWVRRIKVPVLDADGKVVGLLGLMQDITEKKKTELEMLDRDAELQLMIKAAEKSDRAKSDFLSRMSHEIRTPMNAIMGMSRIAENTEDIKKIKICLSRIDVASKHLMGIINDILDMAKIEAGKMELRPEEFSLEKLLMDVCSVVMVKSDERQQNMQVSIDRNVPSGFKGDEFRLSQVLTNLLDNAIKFTQDKGEISLNVTMLGVEEGVATLEFAVSDSGIGISAEQQKGLFTSFEQVNGGMSRKYGGTGLGLAICKRIVELMGGTIRVESREGAGSRFIFNVRMEVVSSRVRDTQVIESVRDRLNILIVDDSDEVRHHFTSLLGEYEIPVSAAASGLEALAMIEAARRAAHPFTVIFVDWRMPDMDGIETTRRIKQEFGDQTIVILISVAEWNNVASEAARVGIKKFLAKPLFPSVIINTINEVLGTPRESSTAGTAALPDLLGKHILLAEDVAINRDILKTILMDTGVTISFAENGIEAVNMFSSDSNVYDMILMDIHMPGMDGYDATKRIRALDVPRAKVVPIVAMTANVFVEDVKRCLDVGMNDHLGKPIEVNKLLSKLSIYLLGSGAQPPIPPQPIPPQPIPSQPIPSQPQTAQLAIPNNAVPLKMDENTNVSEDRYARYLPYLDVEKGLSRIRGNRKLYVTMMKSFLNNTMCKELIAVLAEEDMSKGQYLAHTLKGVAANLSLDRILETITPFEAALKRGNIQEGMLGKLEEAVNTTQTMIDELLKEMDAEASGK